MIDIETVVDDGVAYDFCVGRGVADCIVKMWNAKSEKVTASI